MILGIDPGPVETAYAIIRLDYSIQSADKLPNSQFILLLMNMPQIVKAVACEGIQCYGQPVGKETFETCYMIGEIRYIARAMNTPFKLYDRPEYMRQICGCVPAKGKSDSTLWQALRLRFGGDRKGEPLNALKGATDKRSAFAVAAYHLDDNRGVRSQSSDRAM